MTVGGEKAARAEAASNAAVEKRSVFFTAGRLAYLKKNNVPLGRMLMMAML